MSHFIALPLGRRIPDRPHAVSVSLPTMRDLCGYEEKDPEVMKHLPSGYPRFVVGTQVKRLAEELARREGWVGQRVWPTTSARMAGECCGQLSEAGAEVFSVSGVYGVRHADTPELAARAKTFLQHTGGLLSTRAAEDRLVELGEVGSVEAEEVWEGDARAELVRSLRPVFGGTTTDDLFFTPCGINAVYSSFRVAAEMQAARGRTLWVQLGWLYLDTIAILKKFTGGPENRAVVKRVAERAELERIFREDGGRLAGIVAEVPTNPLVQTPDVPWLAEQARRCGAQLILDASVASPFAVDLLPYADVVVASLTKYTASDGDVIAGVAAVNPERPGAAVWRAGLARRVEPLYGRDMARLAAQIGRTEAVLGQIQENVIRVVEFLEKRPEVKTVYWARRAETAAAFARVARSGRAAGGMVSFEVREGGMARFYDAVKIAKGPSFGMTTSLLCPFIWMAHFDLVTTQAGRAELAESGIEPDLLRLSVGTEPIEEILAALEEGLAAV